MDHKTFRIGARAIRILLLASAVSYLAVPMFLSGGASVAHAEEPAKPAPAVDAKAAAEPSAGPSDPHSMRNADQAADAEALLEAANKAGGEGVITFDLLRSTELKLTPPPIFPEELAKLDGKKVRVRGFMSPFDNLKDMRNCMLFPFATGCFFCAPPSPREVVFIRIESKDPVPFESSAIEIEGTLNLWKDGSADKAHQSFLYVVNDAKVKKIEG
jgi:hypothetical protein